MSGVIEVGGARRCSKVHGEDKGCEFHLEDLKYFLFIEAFGISIEMKI